MARNRAQSSATILSAPQTPLLSGYLLKKKRGPLQGFGRRYFTLTVSGILSYSFLKEGPTRDCVRINEAFIHASRRKRELHIDSDQGLWQLKLLDGGDFDRWTNALRTFMGGATQPIGAGFARVNQPANDGVGGSALEDALNAVAGLSDVSARS